MESLYSCATTVYSNSFLSLTTFLRPSSLHSWCHPSPQFSPFWFTITCITLLLRSDLSFFSQDPVSSFLTYKHTYAHKHTHICIILNLYSAWKYGISDVSYFIYSSVFQLNPFSWKYHNFFFFNHSSLDRHLGWFYLLVVVNTIPIHVDIQVSLWYVDLVCAWIVELGCIGSILRPLHTEFLSGNTQVYIPTSSV